MTMDTPIKRAPWWALETKTVLVIALLIALFSLAARETVDPDLWWHLATGRYVVETGQIPRQDVFSYTVPDHPWITHEWLAEVIIVGLYRFGNLWGRGLDALLLATSALVTATFALVYLQCEARPHGAVFGVLLGALTSAVTWGPRPQMWTMAGLALWGLLLRRYRTVRRRRVLWLYPLLTALWVNLHSGFLLGLAYLGAVIVGEWAAHAFDHRTPETLSLRADASFRTIRDLGLTLGACLLAALLNPNGYRILTYPFETLGSQAMQQYIQEWASPDFHRPEYWPLAILLLGGTAVLALSRPRPMQDIGAHRQRSLTDVGLFCGFGLAALHAARHIPLFAVVAVPILMRYLAARPPSVPPVKTTGGKQEAALPSSPHARGRQEAIPQSPPHTRGRQQAAPQSLPHAGDRQAAIPLQLPSIARAGRSSSPPRAGGIEGGRRFVVLNWILVVLLFSGGAARVAIVLDQNRDVEARHYPVAALAYLEKEGLGSAPIYNSYNWGGYLAWRGIPVYIDGRADVYGDAFMSQYVRAFQVREDWRSPLDQYGVEVVLIERDGSLATLLHESDEWQRVYRDELAVVFTRSE